MYDFVYPLMWLCLPLCCVFVYPLLCLCVPSVVTLSTFCCDFVYPLLCLCLPSVVTLSTLCCDFVYPGNPLLWLCLPSVVTLSIPLCYNFAYRCVTMYDFVYPLLWLCLPSVVTLSTLCCDTVYPSVVILPTPPVLHDFAYLFCQFVQIPPLSLKLQLIHGALVQSKMTASETWHLIGETSNTSSHVQVTHSCQGSGSSLQQK